MHLQEKPGPIFSVSSDQVIVISSEISPLLSLYAEQTHLSQVLPACQVLQPLSFWWLGAGFAPVRQCVS